MSAPVTLLYQRWREGDENALGELLPLIYTELHRMAEAYMRRGSPGQTLQPTALVHEAYLKLFESSTPEIADRAHLFGLMARVMRQVLVDHARAAGAEKRGGREQRVPWDTAIQLQAGDADTRRLLVIELDRALETLNAERPDYAQVIEMHYFAGMTAEEVAEALGKSPHIVRHEIRFARAWLRRELAASRPD